MTKLSASVPLSDKSSERVLLTLNQILNIIELENPIDETIEEIVDSLGAGFTYSDINIRIRYKSIECQTEAMAETINVLTERFSTVDGGKGIIDAYYTEVHPDLDEGPFSRDERSLLNQLARLLTGFINRIVAERNHSESVERLKELSTINRTTRIINEGKSIDDVLQQIAFVLPLGWQYAEYTVARIIFGEKIYQSEYFTETEWVQTQRFNTIDGQQGSIDVFYTKRFPSLNNDPFLAEERDLLINLSRLITDFLNSHLAAREKIERQERVKELQTINETSKIIALKMPIDYTLGHIAEIIPAGMQHPEYSAARIVFEQHEYLSEGFIESPWLLRHSFETIEGKAGAIEIYYQNELAKTQEELFLNEENDLIKNLSHLVVGYLNGVEARNLMEQVRKPMINPVLNAKETDKDENQQSSKHLLQNFMHRNNAARDIYHDLMPFKVKEILLVATLYDAYAIENEGRFTEQVMGGFYQLHLTQVPRVTGVTTYDEAMSKLNEKHFDLIIVMVGVEKKSPMALSQMVKKEYPYIPIFMLLNNDSDIPYFQARQRELGVLDEIFVWNGDPKVFSSMVFHLEDKVNVENDTEIGLARVILLVED
ncbi:MAG: hypothetical protein N4A74_16660, partial [Carboxylicivirga sp.]|nr:hypothetical protein [Carboxylicivirga sp.]